MKRRHAIMRIIRALIVYAVLSAGAFVMVLPFLWMFFSSFKDANSIFTYPPQFLPNRWHFENYINVWKVAPFARWFLNSVLVAVSVTIGILFGSSLAAYAYAKLEFLGKKLLFTVLLATMMVPYQVTLIPMFLLMKALGWVNTFKPLIVPSFAGSAFGIFLLRQFITQLPRELFDAARIDGASEGIISLRITLPLLKPALATLGLLTFLGSWNDLIDPLIYLYDVKKYTLPIGLTYFQGQYSAHWEYLMVGSVVSIVPIIIIFIFTQKYLVEGIKLTGFK